MHTPISQDRPYRGIMPLEQRLEIIRLQVEQGKLDKEAFAALLVFAKSEQKQTVADVQTDVILKKN